MPASAAAVRRTLAGLRNSPVLPRPDDEPWAALIARISSPGRAAEVTDETYDYCTGPTNHVGENVWNSPCGNGYGLLIAVDQQARSVLFGAGLPSTRRCD